MIIIIGKDGKEYGLCGKDQAIKARMATNKNDCDMCKKDDRLHLFACAEALCMYNGFYVRVI